jgi:type II secretory pathway pseudopilin PulG
MHHPLVTTHASSARLCRARMAVVAYGSEQGGFLLVEVLISTLLVALVVVATLTGFDVVDRATAEERRHAQAAVLAAQAQEQMRSDSGAALGELFEASRKYARTINGTVYTVTQEAHPVNAAGTGTGCSATESTAQTSAAIQVTSVVTWARQVTTKRAAVKQSSIVTPPTGSALEVDVTNGSSPLAGVAGVTVSATYTPVESKVANTLEATTGAAGCVVFTALPTTKATVAIKQKLAYITTNGILKYPTKEITLAPNITTHDAVTYNEGGQITGKFTYEGKGGEVLHEGRKETVMGDTFVAFNSSVPAEPHFEVGSTSLEYEVGGEQPYKPVTGTYAAAASTPATTLYPSGDLFPFAGAWQVYAGDCLKDNIETITAGTEKLKPEPAVVEAGKATSVNVPLSYVLVNAKKGTIFKPGAADATSYAVKLRNKECEAEKSLPNNASAVNLSHSQKTNGEGRLEHPFQGYGKYELCIYNATLKNRYTWAYTNSTVGGSSLTVFPTELTKSQWEEQEAANKAKWEKEEKEGKINNEARKNKEKAEKEERTKSEEKRPTYGYSIESGQSSC